MHVHLNDNRIMPERSSENYDKLFKVRTFLVSLKNNSQSFLQPHENVAVDESMIKFKGRSTLKEYLPKKGYNLLAEEQATVEFLKLM